MQCYDVHDEISFHALVFATCAEQALEIGTRHRDAGFGEGHTAISVISRQVPFAGSDRDRLKSALAQNKSGIGHLRSDGIWDILPAGVRPLESVRPEPTEMRTYEDDDGHEYVIFAKSEDRTETIFEAILNAPRSLPKAWKPMVWKEWSTKGLVRNHRQAERRGVEGIGLYTAAGWCILAIDYLAFDIDPP